MTCCCSRSCCLFISIIVTVLLAFGLRHLLFSSDVGEVDIPRTGYFGPGKPKPDSAHIEPFSVNFTSAEIAELQQRLRAARIGHQQLEDVSDWSYGFPLDELLEWRDHWANKFDFEKAQAKLNEFPQFRTQLEGLMIHFLHVKPPRPAAYRRIVPLVLVHGWPGGTHEFHRIIPMLIDPKANSLETNGIAFEVVIPSIPGYGFSDQPHKKGFNAVATARIFNRLMVERLGHRRYMAQGGDWGSLIVTMLGQHFADNVRAVHVNMAFMSPFKSARHFWISLIGRYFPNWVFSDAEHFQDYSFFKQLPELLTETGYMHIQATKPDTVGVALNDSPLGILAYILEKFSTWTNPGFRALSDGGLLKKYTREQLLTILSVYWFRGNILSSQRYYKENLGSGQLFSARSSYVAVPTAYAAFPYDMGGVQPRELIQLNYNMTQMTIFPDGGHFAALEMPRELAGDVLKFTGKLTDE